MSAGGLEGLQREEKVPALAGFSDRHTEELEKLLPSEGSGSYCNSDSLEGIQGEEALPQNARSDDTVTGKEQRIPRSTQVSEGVELVGSLNQLISVF